MNYIEMKIEKIEKKLKELEQEIKKPKENTDFDIELAYLNDNVGYGTEYGWDKSFGNYKSIDGQNNDYNYKIEMDNKDKWIFKIQNKFGETIVKIIADKKN